MPQQQALGGGALRPLWGAPDAGAAGLPVVQSLVEKEEEEKEEETISWDEREKERGGAFGCPSPWL